MKLNEQTNRINSHIQLKKIEKQFQMKINEYPYPIKSNKNTFQIEKNMYQYPIKIN